ncbi:radical SAM protein [Spinactinospora alkalitolerans]
MRRLSSTFQTLILQPTPLCNLNCAYCYICPSSRRTRRDMPLPVAAALASSVQAQESSSMVDVVWHGGEPLAIRRDHFEELVEVFELLRTEGRIRHFIQTNATLIDDGWCDFFTRYEFRVGVSLDGPDSASANRVDWAGKPVFPRIMRGVQALKKHGIDFSVICVVFPETVNEPDALFDFFEDLGAGSVGFNIEEYEGANDSRQSIDAGTVRHFWRTMFARLANGSDLRVREAGKLLGYLAEVKAGSVQDRRRHRSVSSTTATRGTTAVAEDSTTGPPGTTGTSRGRQSGNEGDPRSQGPPPSEDEDAVTAWPFGSPLEREKVSNTEFRGVDLSSHRWKDITVTRCRFSNARFMGLALAGASLSDVLFENCQFDFAVLDRLKVAGDVAFIGCSFKEAAFSNSDLSRAVFDDCTLSGAEFDSTRMQDADLRASNLSGISGLSSLKGVQVTEAQLADLFQALASELELKVTDIDG